MIEDLFELFWVEAFPLYERGEVLTFHANISDEKQTPCYTFYQ